MVGAAAPLTTAVLASVDAQHRGSASGFGALLVTSQVTSSCEPLPFVTGLTLMVKAIEPPLPVSSTA